MFCCTNMPLYSKTVPLCVGSFQFPQNEPPEYWNIGCEMFRAESACNGVRTIMADLVLLACYIPVPPLCPVCPPRPTSHLWHHVVEECLHVSTDIRVCSTAAHHTQSVILILCSICKWWWWWWGTVIGNNTPSYT